MLLPTYLYARVWPRSSAGLLELHKAALGFLLGVCRVGSKVTYVVDMLGHTS